MYNVGSSLAATLNSANFGQIDFLLVGREWLHKISSVASCMDMPLASHHFPVIAEIDVDLPKAIATTSRGPRFHLCELQSGPTSSLFATFFHECMLQCDCGNGTADELCSAMATSFQQSAERCLHRTKRQAHKPWISSRTLHLLEERDDARASRNPHLEKILHGQVKQSVKMDRSQWLDDLFWKREIGMKYADCAEDTIFMVRDGGATSHQHPQCFGISPGCPLSPFLFSIVTTMLIQDAKATFLSSRGPARTGEISELMYADDTLLLATNNEDAEIYMQCIEQAGRMYGLQLNWNKLEVLPVRCEARVRTPNGELVVSKESLVYLGSYLCDNGSIGPELNRRLGAARAEFETLSRVWNHAVLPKSEKIRIFEACVLSKLLYCLHTAWLNKAELRRLNAFQSKCFRKILNIPHSYVSRISNKTVLERSGRQEISNIFTYRQLVLVGKIAALPFTDVRRQCVFSGHTLRPRIVEQPQRRGRPKNSWGSKVYKLATDVVGGADLDEALFSFLKQWKILARSFCFAQRQ